MKILRLSIFAALLISTQVSFAQMCDGFITFNNQEALDQFAIDNPDCTEISGDVYLQFGVDTEGTPITNTDALQNISIIGGRLTLEDNPMTSGYPVSLSGLSGMTYYYDLYIYSYANLTSLDGLDNITTIEGDLFIGMYGEDLSLAPLNNITSVFNVTFAGGPTASFENVLPGLTEIFGAVNIGYESPEFESFTGLENLLFCDALQVGYTAENSVNFQVFDACHNLQTCNYLILFCSTQTLFSGFENLTSCTNLEVWNTDAANPIVFNSLYGVEMLLIVGDFTNGITFPTLQAVDQLYLEASGPIALTEVPYMSSIYVQYCGINAPLELQLNDTLNTVQLYVQYNAFEDLSFFPEGGTILSYLTLAYNENLSYCGHPAVCSFVALNPETSYIELNASGCNDSMEALASCGETLVSGKVYYDADCNGTFGGNDIPMSYQFILDDNGNIISATNLNGDYFIPASGNSIITIAPDTIIGLLLPTPISIDLGAVQGNLANQDFPLCQDLNAYNVSVHLFPQDQLRPGFNADLAVLVNNQTWSAVSGTVTVDLSQMTGTTIVEAFAGTINGMEITFPIETLDPFSDQIYYYTVNTNAGVPLGTLQTISASIVLDGGTDNYALDDSASLTLEVIGSYDPNDITVNRPEIDYNNYDAANGEWLEYLIRFQNTGTAEAIFIHVLDTIAEELNLSSLEILQTSHPMEMSIDGSEVDFFFNDIYLPDSTSNPEGSQGFIFYRIRTAQNLTLEDIIPNQAAIYFDFNSPIYTNTATTTFYTDCPADPAIGGLTTLCGPGTFDLEALGDYTDYAWIIEGENPENGNAYSFTSTEVSEVTGTLIATDGLCGASVPFTLITYEAALTPQIVQNGNTLLATGSGTFTWTYNNEPVSNTSNALPMESSGLYSVYYTTADGCVSTLVEGMFELCPAEAAASGITEICAGESFELVGLGPFEIWNWSYDMELIGTGANLDWAPMEPGSYTLQLTGTIGSCFSTIDVDVVMYPIPTAAPIQADGNTLTANGTGVFTWYLDGELLPDTDNSIEATESGTYTAQVTTNGCSSDLTEIEHTYIGVESLSLALWQIYPNPVSDAVRIDRDESFTRPYTEIYNTMGALVYSTTNNASYFMIECNQWASGLYTVRHGDLNSGICHSKILVVR
jgi:Secretion system C-terminal sorting domain